MHHVPRPVNFLLENPDISLPCLNGIHQASDYARKQTCGRISANYAEIGCTMPVA